MESTLKISAPIRSASAIASADLPEAVGPITTRMDGKTVMSAMAAKMAEKPNHIELINPCHTIVSKDELLARRLFYVSFTYAFK
ncbi:MAG TPA: hypothetical protein VHS31_19560, partial [Tepidisphaeraceae bacterium]|nr:hypothetical protein [Tepidisphaeraceae bacterium]